MNLNDLLVKNEIDPKTVIVLRHRPKEPELRKILPWLASERPDLYNAYQQSQAPGLESSMDRLKGTGYIASFIEYGTNKAIFVGLYTIEGATRVGQKQFWAIPENAELYARKMIGADFEKRGSLLWFDLQLTDILADWKGKLIIHISPGRAWYRRAHTNDMPILAILEDNSLAEKMPEWDELILSWEELAVIPDSWKKALLQWRGIYFIFDESDGKGYVGSAYGDDNLLGRWLTYQSTGHGGNKLLKKRDPRNFKFSILQRVSPDMEPHDVINIESTWKERLHTRQPFGLNDN